MKPRRLGCLAFGVCWTALFLFTNFGLALGHPDHETSINPLEAMFWIELAVFVIGAAVFVRAEIKDPEL
jgi:hypothetical protein